MRHSKRKFVSARLIGGFAALLLAASASPAADWGPACPNPQSPRDVVAGFDGQASASIVEVIVRERVNYTPRAGGETQELHRCGQHYHFPIENQQRCAGEFVAGAENPGEPGPGNTVEVHTVYAGKADPNQCKMGESSANCCDPESLNCCKEGPFVVRAFNAVVSSGGERAPIEPPTGGPLAEWTGSTTGPDESPGQCKPEAQWSFRLGCGFTVTEGQLSGFDHAHGARRLQAGYRASQDLTLVTPD